jgi:hypothetical protein
MRIPTMTQALPFRSPDVAGDQTIAIQSQDEQWENGGRYIIWEWGDRLDVTSFDELNSISIKLEVNY